MTPHVHPPQGVTMTRIGIRNADEPEGMTRCNCCHTLHKDEDFGRHFDTCPQRQRWGYIEPVIVNPS